jgi:hypothetical protein
LAKPKVIAFEPDPQSGFGQLLRYFAEKCLGGINFQSYHSGFCRHSQTMPPKILAKCLNAFGRALPDRMVSYLAQFVSPNIFFFQRMGSNAVDKVEPTKIPQEIGGF